MAMVLPCARICMIPSTGATIFEGGIHWILPKTEHYEAFSLSLPYEIFCLKPFFGACSYAVSHSRSLHTYGQTQKRVSLDLIVAFLCLLICMSLKWETTYEQAQEWETAYQKQVLTEYFTRKREKKVLHIYIYVFSLKVLHIYVVHLHGHPCCHGDLCSLASVE